MRHILSALALLAGLPVPADATPPHPRAPIVERVVIVMRHGIRAPLDGEVPAGTRAAAPWPRWPVAESRLTPHGLTALAIVAAADARRLRAEGVLAQGCGAPGAVRIWTNVSDRTIASGGAYARALLPGCDVAIGHRDTKEVDPIFEPLRARATAFDARKAIASIDQYTGGMDALVRRHADAIALLDRVLGCVPRGEGCVPGARAAVRPSADGRDIVLEGPIRGTSGVAQVLLLQYVEGMPAADAGWGRIDAAGLARLGALHAALFDVFTRAPYMAAHQASVLGRHVLDTLADPQGPRVEVLMGHDTNVTALAAALRTPLPAPGYATGDVPPGGAILIEQLRAPGSGRRFVRLFYRTQSPDALRGGGAAVTLTPLTMAGCARLCPAQKFAMLLRGRLAG